MKRKQTKSTFPVVRCAIYTRKSTEEGLNQEFNTLDAQRESAEAFITSQQHEGWTCLPQRYDDGGFTGGNLDRPAMRKLTADIEAGKVDCVVVYKVDRLSRSLMDFAKLMATFDEHKVSFVSVTQQFNTATRMGRLVLNVLLSFAQFEREIISERTRDKMAATRRKGKWSGGQPILGYDIDTSHSKLIVNPDEAESVRAIFNMYLKHDALLPVVQELEERGWTNKSWQTKNGTLKGGKPFNKTSLHRLLTNIAYVGKISYRDEIYEGEHHAIVDAEVWESVQQRLQQNAAVGGAPIRNKFGCMLQGLLRCTACKCAMTPTHTTKKNKRYNYYTCSQAQKRGWHTCPIKSVPAAEMEAFVLDRIRGIGRDSDLLRDVLEQAQQQDEARLKELKTEERLLNKDLTAWHAEMRKLTVKLYVDADTNSAVTRLADLQERIGQAEQRLAKVREHIKTTRKESIDPTEAEHALSAFDPVWQMLTPKEQTRIIRLLIEKVDYDGVSGKVAITFHTPGIKTLADELQQRKAYIA